MNPHPNPIPRPHLSCFPSSPLSPVSLSLSLSLSLTINRVVCGHGGEDRPEEQRGAEALSFFAFPSGVVWPTRRRREEERAQSRSAQPPGRANKGYRLLGLHPSDSSIRVLGRLAMGAPKQKWTSEEESALKAGILKHGAGRWRTILKDPEFSGILYLRSNVDLKDKWRNMNVMANGSGSRGKSRISLKKTRLHDDNPMAISTLDDFDDEIIDAQPLASSSETLQISGPKRSILRLDNHILEAITNLKEPTGSNKTAIAMYIEDQYMLPPNFKEELSAKLMELTASGKLIKVKRKYRIAPTSAFSGGRKSKLLLLEGRQREPSRLDRDDFKPLTKSQIDAELARMRNMTAQEAAVAAAQAVAEAEAAMAEAEQGAREAEAAEADAEAAQAFADAAALTLKNGNTANLMVRV